jgi:hypothetical protein
MRHELRPILLSFVFTVSSVGCFQELNQSATSSASPTLDFGSVVPSPDGGIPTILDPNYPLRYGGDGTMTADPCVATVTQSLHIRETYCGMCHGPSGTQGQPLFNFVLDDNKMMTTTDMASKLLFVAAGDPDRSRVYQRMVQGTMPPLQVSVDQPGYPRPTASDLSVVFQWIICLSGAGPSN